MADKRTRYRIPKGVKKEAMDGRDLRQMHGYGGGKVTKMINRKLRMQKDVGYDTAFKIDTYYRRHEKVDPPAKGFGDRRNPSKGYVMWKQMGGDKFTSERMNELVGGGYGDMINGNSNVPVTVDGQSADFLKKDYRGLMKAIDKKTNK